MPLRNAGAGKRTEKEKRLFGSILRRGESQTAFCAFVILPAHG